MLSSSSFPRLKKVFPGSNSAYGFFSFYDYIISKEANRLYIIKGGPGTGKSTFIKDIGEDFFKKGFQVEFHYCSSNSKSLDGVVIPAKKAAVIDGTAPHVVDPAYTGAFDEIIHLGKFLNSQHLQENKDVIIKVNEEKQRYFYYTYTLLYASKMFLNAAEYCWALEAQEEKAGLSNLTRELIEEIISDRTGKHPRGRLRKLFATGITPEGAVNLLTNLTAELYYVYLLYGENGAVKGDILRKIMEAALQRGFYVEAYCCALDPYRIDHIIIPQLFVGIVNSKKPHFLHPRYSYKEIDVDGVAYSLQKKKRGAEKQEFHERHRNTFVKAISFLNEAKILHDELEEYYKAAMHFGEEFNQLKEEIKLNIQGLS